MKERIVIAFLKTGYWIVCVGTCDNLRSIRTPGTSLPAGSCTGEGILASQSSRSCEGGDCSCLAEDHTLVC